MRNKLILFLSCLAILFACQNQPEPIAEEAMKPQKIVVYQVFPRLFGNTNTTNKPWGTIEENGTGKFNDFTDLALEEIKKLGVSHIWYTGVPHHALIGDYSAIGVSADDPDVVKGRAGSPYAVKDYYQVNPDLAVDPAKRMEEFEALIARTHAHDMKVIIDIVPNHVARRYEGKNNPEGVSDFGASDDQSVEYARNNNFYYIPGQPFRVPEPRDNYRPLGGEKHPLADGKFDENPAKWTGNGSRMAQPDFYDWYETVKVNYGIKPDGSKDFPELPTGADSLDWKAHFDFWQGKEVPDSWIKFKDITQFWLTKNVDGFRFDMAEMVPVEFWSYLNSHIKNTNPDAFLLAEVYNPSLYRDYIRKGKMDYLYDKVELYDTLRNVIQDRGTTWHIAAIQDGLADIEHHMLHFLENHDEQRIASPQFANDPWKAMPAMVVSATISTSPTMIYSGQEVGENASEKAGFGDPSRTSIFDYIGIPAHQRWMNGGKFDGGQLYEHEKNLRATYVKLLNLTRKSSALMGKYQQLHHPDNGPNRLGGKAFAFARWSETEKLIIAANFDSEHDLLGSLNLSQELTSEWGLADGSYELTDQLGNSNASLEVKDGYGYINFQLGKLESGIWKVKVD
ncbi:alpha-amylase family protein [Algoriphagus marinus]|uniref:alpha-amylase family protein n=1 Tax=Algoriphagus marinus TaxID=1925762 RepID=UPI00094B7C70|nr:alpha-amylase family protein [Algoriphagus marinus]